MTLQEPLIHALKLKAVFKKCMIQKNHLTPADCCLELSKELHAPTRSQNSIKKHPYECLRLYLFICFYEKIITAKQDENLQWQVLFI